MAEIKLTKNELRTQQLRLAQLNRYLPTLQLKKAMLQAEVNDARLEIAEREKEFAEARERVQKYCLLFTEQTSVDLVAAGEVLKVHKSYENIAGVDVPTLTSVDFAALEYSLYETPPWVDSAVVGIRAMSKTKAAVAVAEEKKAALEEELRQVSIRVNLFEKILIPRSIANIKKIKVFLGDQELSAVSQAKVAKGKILQRKLDKLEEVAHAL